MVLRITAAPPQLLLYGLLFVGAAILYYIYYRHSIIYSALPHHLPFAHYCEKGQHRSVGTPPHLVTKTVRLAVLIL